MLLRVRKHLSYTNVAMTLALVFAMSGGLLKRLRHGLHEPLSI